MFLLILLLLLLVFLYLLLVPVILFMDTSTNLYFIQIKGLAKATIEADEKALIKINLKVFFLVMISIL